MAPPKGRGIIILLGHIDRSTMYVINLRSLCVRLPAMSGNGRAGLTWRHLVNT